VPHLSVFGRGDSPPEPSATTLRSTSSPRLMAPRRGFEPSKTEPSLILQTAEVTRPRLAERSQKPAAGTTSVRPGVAYCRLAADS
jgi:hypothetical protein